VTAPRRLAVLIPALNEEASVGAVVAAVMQAEPLLVAQGVSTTVILVDDGSTDRTGEFGQAAGADIVIRHKLNRGLGAAVRSGLHRARDEGFDLMLKLDADGQHDPADIPAMIRPILDDEAEVVYGYRFGRIGYRMPLVRRWGNATFCGLMRWLTGWPVRDSQPGIIALSSDYLKVAHLPGSYNYAQQVLLDAWHKGMRFSQVDVAFRERRSGASFISWAYPFRALAQIFWLLVSLKPLRIFGPIGVAFLALAAGVGGWQIAEFLQGHAAKPIENVNLVLGAALFGIQTLFFGVLAELIVQRR
jgi:glycosyltransferase involved in cell wall biosynthesis